jgi:phosphatidyl-myo-inositol dimannoside synthase
VSERDRVLVLSLQFGGRDGLSELGRQVVRAVAGDGSHVSAYSLADTSAAPLPATVRFTTAGGSVLRFGWQATAPLASARRGDTVVLLHAHLLPLALIAAARGATLVAVLVGIEAWKPLTWLQRAGLSRVSRLIAISRHTADRFLAANPSTNGRTIAIVHPAVPEMPPPEPTAIPPGFALMVGRMSAEERYKGHDEMIAAWPAVRASWPDARLVIAGDGNDRRRLEQTASAAGVADAIRFVGLVPDAELAAMYGAARFLVMPSRDEGFGLVYLEAMRLGVPCIASPGAAGEIIDDGRDGLLVAPGDVTAIAAACVRLFTDAALCRRLGEAAAASVARRFTFSRFATELRAAIDGREAAAC